MTVELRQLTTGEVSGSGVFDSLMRSVKAHLKEEYDANRLTGSDYATVYMNSIQLVLSTSSQYTLSVERTNAELAILEQKLYTEQAQTMTQVNGSTVTGVLGKQMDLFQAQTDGFARDAEQKAAKMLLDTWVVRQTTDGEDAPSAGVDNPSIKEVVNLLRNGVGLGNT